MDDSLFVLDEDTLCYAEATLRLREVRLKEREEEVELRELRYLRRLLSMQSEEQMVMAMERGVKNRAKAFSKEVKGVLNVFLNSSFQPSIHLDSNKQRDLEVARELRRLAADQREKTLLARLEAMAERVKKIEAGERALLNVGDRLNQRKTTIEQMRQRLAELSRGAGPGTDAQEVMKSFESIPAAAPDPQSHSHSMRTGIRLRLDLLSDHRLCRIPDRGLAPGIFIATRNALPMNTEVLVHAHVLEQKEWSTPGQVVWVGETRISGVRIPGMAVELLEVGRDVSDVIDVYAQQRPPIEIGED